MSRRSWALGAGAAVLLVGLILYAWHLRAQATQAALLRHRSELHGAMDMDTTVAYREVVTVGQALMERGRADELIKEMVTYAATILAIEHQDEGMLVLSRKLLLQLTDRDVAGDAVGAEGYLTAARILASYGDGDLTEGLALAESVRGSDAGLVMAKLEGLRLMVAAKVEVPKVTVTAQDLGSCVTDEVRALCYLGLWQLSQNNTALGEQYLQRAISKSPGHPQALLGLQWVRLRALHPQKSDLWQAQKTAGDVLRLPPHALTPPVRATALLLRALATELEGDAPQAERDRAEAIGLDPTNLLHEVSRDGPARP